MDEIRLVKGPAPGLATKNELASSNREKMPSSSDSARSASSTSSSKRHAVPRSTSTLDVKHTLSSETSDALASLEASLAKLQAKTRSPPGVTPAPSKKQDSGDSTLKRELGAARVSGLPSSRTQIFRAKTSISGGDSSFNTRSNADQSGDSSVFKRPSGRVSALAKSRESSSDLRSALNPSLASSKSMMTFGAPRLPGYSEVSGRATKPLLAGSRTSSLDMSSRESKSEEEAAQKEEEARVAEAKRQAELKAAKRKSMSSILSSGMPPPLQRKEVDAARAPSGSSSKSAASTPSTATPEETAAESVEAKKAAKAARRRSLYTYVPSMRDDGLEGDRSIGNLSASLGISGSASASEGDSSTAKKARFLRGLTVLVDVRDQDGEDASACWVEMLKNAGAKVLVRFGERKLTHIVYKSGRPSTLHSYRALDDPKPHVVGISWVVACLEQGKKADETPYLVEVAKQAIFATVSTKARRADWR